MHRLAELDARFGDAIENSAAAIGGAAFGLLFLLAGLQYSAELIKLGIVSRNGGF